MSAAVEEHTAAASPPTTTTATDGDDPTTNPMPPTSPEALAETLQQQLNKQKDTMKKWKENVKAQLMEAQGKNRALKEERDTARSQLQAAELEIRGRLQEEYKDRLVDKDEEIKRLTEGLAAARAQRQTDAEEHLKLLERQKEQFEKAAQATAADANATFNTELVALEKQLKAASDETEAVRHELSVQVAKTNAVEARLREATSAAAAAATAEGSAEKERANRYEAELKSLQTELATAKNDIEAAKRRYIELQETNAIALSQRVQEEVQQRDDQLNVLQVLLRQCQSDVGVYQQRCVALQGQLDEERDAREAKLATLRQDLLGRMATIEELTRQVDSQKHHVGNLEASVSLLEEEKEIRERAFAEIFLSDDQKQMIKVLEDQLQDSQHRMLEAAEAKGTLERELAAAKAANLQITQQAAAEKALLSEQRSDIETKMARLIAQEKKTKEQSEVLAMQADRLRMAMAGGAAANGGMRGGIGGGVNKVGGGVNRGGLGGGGGASSSSATASVPIVEVDEHGKLIGDMSALDGTHGSGGGTLTGNFTAMIENLRANHEWANVASNVVSAVNNNLRSRVRYQQLSTYQQYKRLLPIIFAMCFFGTFFYYWLFSSTSVKAGQTLKAQDVQVTVNLVRQQYNALAEKYNQCCSMKAVLMPMEGQSPAM